MEILKASFPPFASVLAWRSLQDWYTGEHLAAALYIYLLTKTLVLHRSIAPHCLQQHLGTKLKVGGRQCLGFWFQVSSSFFRFLGI